MTPPGKPLGMSDFFALEAGEYLERLDALLQQSEAPGADEFVRLARAPRGRAPMGNPQGVAQAAAGARCPAPALPEGPPPRGGPAQDPARRATPHPQRFPR